MAQSGRMTIPLSRGASLIAERKVSLAAFFQDFLRLRLISNCGACRNFSVALLDGREKGPPFIQSPAHRKRGRLDRFSCSCRAVWAWRSLPKTRASRFIIQHCQIQLRRYALKIWLLGTGRSIWCWCETVMQSAWALPNELVTLK